MGTARRPSSLRVVQLSRCPGQEGTLARTTFLAAMLGGVGCFAHHSGAWDGAGAGSGRGWESANRTLARKMDVRAVTAAVSGRASRNGDAPMFSNALGRFRRAMGDSGYAGRTESEAVWLGDC